MRPEEDETGRPQVSASTFLLFFFFNHSNYRRRSNGNATDNINRIFDAKRLVRTYDGGDLVENNRKLEIRLIASIELQIGVYDDFEFDFFYTYTLLTLFVYRRNEKRKKKTAEGRSKINKMNMFYDVLVVSSLLHRTANVPLHRILSTGVRIIVIIKKKNI